MILMGKNPFRGPLDGEKSISRAILEGVGHENWNFFGPWNGSKRSECHLGPTKLRFSGPTPSSGPSNGFAPIKNIESRRYIKLQVQWYFMYMRLAAAM